MPQPPDIWTVRHAIYRHFAETARAPEVEEIAAVCRITPEQAKAVLLDLDKAHALFLDPGTFDIRIANPFSSVPTEFRVAAGRRTYFANCAWDSFGVIAALGSDEGEIEAVCAENGASLRLAVRDGEVMDHGEVVHFLVPFSSWYEDLVFT